MSNEHPSDSTRIYSAFRELHRMVPPLENDDDANSPAALAAARLTEAEYWLHKALSL